MSRIFNIDSPIMQWLQRIGTVILCGFFWFLLCLPVVTAGAATTAMYRIMFHLREDKTSTIKEYFRAFRDDFRKSTVLFLLDFVCFALLALFFAFIYYKVQTGILMYLLVGILLLFLIVWLFTFSLVFPLTAYFENTVGNTLKNGLFMAFGYRRHSIPVVALGVLPIAFCIVFAQISWEMFFYFILYILPIWVFVIIPLLFYRQSYHLLKIFEIYVPGAEGRENSR